MPIFPVGSLFALGNAMMILQLLCRSVPMFQSRKRQSHLVPNLSGTDLVRHFSWQLTDIWGLAWRHFNGLLLTGVHHYSAKCRNSQMSVGISVVSLQNYIYVQLICIQHNDKNVLTYEVGCKYVHAHVINKWFTGNIFSLFSYTFTENGI